jgi:hypothetical protein
MLKLKVKIMLKAGNYKDISKQAQKSSEIQQSKSILEITRFTHSWK